MTREQKILIVDDRKENLLVLEKTLADAGAMLVPATSGDEALAAALNAEFALAILDVQMPGMDGYELAELLRGDPKSRHMPIVFLTAASTEETQIFRGYESGAVDYIVKPYDPVILVAKVQVFLEMDRVRAELAEHRDHLDRLVEERTAELVTEVEERRRAEARLEEAVEALKRSNRELEQFAYVASHDLQEPLRMVASFTQLLAQRYEGKLDDEADTYIGFAVEGATRMQALISDLLQFSRVGTRGREPEPTDAAEVLRDVITDLTVAIEESGAEVDAGDLPVVLVDRTQLRQVLQNLVGNAIKFRGDEPPRIEVSAERVDEEWAITVADNGIGIDPQFQERIFAIFQRLHARGKYPGTGIGLAVVRKIVERHGGEIRVESAAGEGARFTFTMPAAVESVGETGG